jgi:hypothetical protein
MTEEPRDTLPLVPLQAQTTRCGNLPLEQPLTPNPRPAEHPMG